MFKYTLFLVLFFSNSLAWSQPQIIAGVGLGDIKLGATADEIVDVLGFKGIKLTKAGVPDVLNLQAEMLGIDYDYVYNYQHLMAIPISAIYFKEDKAVMIVVSSYPEYFEMLCLGIKTKEGLNFWDGINELKKIYGKDYATRNSGFEFFYYSGKGISVSIDNKEIRTMTIFKPQA